MALTDPGNDLLDCGPFRLSFGECLDDEQQSRLVMTVRTPSATVTVYMTAREAVSAVTSFVRAASRFCGAGFLARPDRERVRRLESLAH